MCKVPVAYMGHNIESTVPSTIAEGFMTGALFDKSAYHQPDGVTPYTQ